MSISWAETKKVLSKGFPREQISGMNPAEVDNRHLDVDRLDTFGTMGPTDIAIDTATFRLKISGKVRRPLSLSYEQLLKYPPTTETVLLICPGFFANNGRWTGIGLKILIEEAEIEKEAAYLDVRGAQDKVTRIALKELDQKKIFLAYQVNGTPLPRKHGFPIRLVYEDAYGSDWVKYVDEITVS